MSLSTGLLDLQIGSAQLSPGAQKTLRKASRGDQARLITAIENCDGLVSRISRTWGLFLQVHVQNQGRFTVMGVKEFIHTYSPENRLTAFVSSQLHNTPDLQNIILSPGAQDQWNNTFSLTEREELLRAIKNYDGKGQITHIDRVWGSTLRIHIKHEGKTSIIDAEDFMIDYFPEHRLDAVLKRNEIVIAGSDSAGLKKTICTPQAEVCLKHCLPKEERERIGRFIDSYHKLNPESTEVIKISKDELALGRSLEQVGDLVIHLGAQTYRLQDLMEPNASKKVKAETVELHSDLKNIYLDCKLSNEMKQYLNIYYDLYKEPAELEIFTHWNRDRVWVKWPGKEGSMAADEFMDTVAAARVHWERTGQIIDRPQREEPPENGRDSAVGMNGSLVSHIGGFSCLF